jgi:uncharacterized protein YdaL
VAERIQIRGRRLALSERHSVSAATRAFVQPVAAIGLGALLLLLLAACTQEKHYITWEPPPRGALILYDADPSSVQAKQGMAYAIMLSNLLGHFPLEAELMAIADYQAGSIDRHQATFYFGSHFDYPLPQQFLADVATTARTVVWFRYNLWQLTDNRQLQFARRFGLRSLGVRGLNSLPSEEIPDPGFFRTVSYQGTSLDKYYRYDVQTGNVAVDPDVVAIDILDASKVERVADIRNSATGETLPYIVRAANFWFVADIPFSFIGPRDRYLVIADVLHDMLAIKHRVFRQALLRLEDISPKGKPAILAAVVQYLAERQIEFSIAVIPRYRDPFGANNNGVPEELTLSQSPQLVAVLSDALSRGAALVMHGETHQRGNTRNPFSGVSGQDFEFWDAVANQPLPDESAPLVLDALDRGIAELSAVGLRPYAWETPHYQASPLSYRTFPRRFPLTYQRVVYYTAELPQLNATFPGRDYAVGQFFPFLIEKDYYGQKILPENIGDIELPSVLPTEYASNDCEALLNNARYARVLRDGVASFFFHPYLVDGPQGEQIWGEFRCVVEGITALDFAWVGGENFAHTTPATLP